VVLEDGAAKARLSVFMCLNVASATVAATWNATTTGAVLSTSARVQPRSVVYGFGAQLCVDGPVAGLRVIPAGRAPAITAYSSRLRALAGLGATVRLYAAGHHELAQPAEPASLLDRKVGSARRCPLKACRRSTLVLAVPG